MGIFMGRTVPSADPSTVWLADLIEAAEVLAASAEPCDPAIVRAFSHRLEMPGLPLLPYDSKERGLENVKLQVQHANFAPQGGAMARKAPARVSFAH